MAKKSNSDCVAPRQAWLRSKYQQGIYHRQHWQDANGDRNPIRKVERFPWLSDVSRLAGGLRDRLRERGRLHQSAGKRHEKYSSLGVQTASVVTWSQQNTLKLNNQLL